MHAMFWIKAVFGGLGVKHWCAAFTLGSLGGSYSSNQSKSQAWYPRAGSFINQFIPEGKDLLANSQAVDNPNSTMALDELKKEVGGYYTDPANNPTLAPSVAGIENEANLNLGRNIAGINRNAAGNGMLLSTKDAQAGDEAARVSQQGVTDRVAQLYQSEYDKARGAQTAAVQPLLANADPNYVKALQLLSAFGGMGTSNSSGFGVSVSGSAGGAG